jgi:hypothetical protein
VVEIIEHHKLKIAWISKMSEKVVAFIDKMMRL